MNPLTIEFTGLQSEDIFVDRMEMLAVLAGMVNKPTMKYVAVSRPRGFGKTLDANMIAAFFEKNRNKAQFRKLNISKHTAICRKHRGIY